MANTNTSYWMQATNGNYSNGGADTFDPANGYAGVRLKMGVPLLDRDWNELEDIRRYQEMVLRKWYIGDGTPNDGFKISVNSPSNNNFNVSAGRYLVDGFEAVNDNATDYQTLLATGSASALPTVNGIYQVWLNLWLEEVPGPDNHADVGQETTRRHVVKWKLQFTLQTPVVIGPSPIHLPVVIEPYHHLIQLAAITFSLANGFTAITSDNRTKIIMGNQIDHLKCTDLELHAGSEGQAAPVEALRIYGPNTPGNSNSAQDVKWHFNAAGSAGIRAYRDTSWGTHLQLLTNAQSQGSDAPQVRMHIAENGNVGIGKTPDAGVKLDVVGNICTNGYLGINSLILNDYQTVNPQSNVYLYSSGNDRDSWLFRDSADKSSNWGIYHRQIDSTVKNLPANSIGYVGGGNSDLKAYICLGDGSAYFKGDLSVSGNIIPSTGSGTNNGIRFPSDPGGGGGDSAWIRYYPRTGESCTLEIGISNDADDHIALMPSGGVGIGTISPTAKLELNMSNAAGWGGNLEAMRVFSPDNRYWMGLKTYVVAGGNVGYSFGPNGNYGALTISTPGNVGIGTTIPSGAQLSVNGAIESLTVPTGDIYSAGLVLLDEVTRGKWQVHSHGDVLRMWNGSTETIVGQQASTLAIKENIEPLTNALEKIIQLNAVTFNFKSTMYGGKKGIGFIAEEMAKKIPEVVGEDKDGKPISIDYGTLSTVAIQGIKELYSKMHTIENSIKNWTKGNDFAEYFESANGKGIKPGTSVVLEGEKIRAAKKGESPIGVVSVNPTIISGTYYEWPGKYLRDEFNAMLMEEYKEEIMVQKKKTITSERQKTEKKKISEEIVKREIVLKNGKAYQIEKKENIVREIETPIFKEVDLFNENGKEVIGKYQLPVMESFEEEIPEYDDKGNPVMVGSGKFIARKRPKLNPKYKDSFNYVTRDKRPEWICVGLVGQIPLRKGQPVGMSWVKIRDVSDNVELWLVK